MRTDCTVIALFANVLQLIAIMKSGKVLLRYTEKLCYLSDFLIYI